MGLRRRGPAVLAALLLLFTGAAGAVEANAKPANPWRKTDGTLSEDCLVVSSPGAWASLAIGDGETIPSVLPGDFAVDDPPVAGEPLLEERIQAYQTPGSRSVRIDNPEYLLRPDSSRAMLDRGIDSADTKWRRQARLQGVRMRMLNGPEATLSGDVLSSDTERGIRSYTGAVVPLNTRWELTALNKFAYFQRKSDGRRAGLEALTLRVGANPSVSFRPWFAVTPYTGLGDGDGVGMGLNAGVSKYWRSGISLTGEAYAFEPWDEGYETFLNDGRSHGFRARGTLPVDRRLTFTAEADYEWLELGPHAPEGSQYAGRRGSWGMRGEFLLLKRDSAYMGYGFRDQNLWSEELVPIELGVFADIYWERYIRPRGFETLSPTEKSFRQRVGLFYYQAFSNHIGINSEAYVGQDPRRGVSIGDLYGASLRLNLVVNPHLRMWAGWGYESSATTLEGGGGPDRTFSFGLNYNF